MSCEPQKQSYEEKGHTSHIYTTPKLHRYRNFQIEFCDTIASIRHPQKDQHRSSWQISHVLTPLSLFPPQNHHHHHFNIYTDLVLDLRTQKSCSQKSVSFVPFRSVSLGHKRTDIVTVGFWITASHSRCNLFCLSSLHHHVIHHPS